MSYMLCYKLIPLSIGIVRHGFEESTNRFLVPWCDASVLLDQLLFFWSKHLPERRGTPACQHKSRIDTAFFKCCHIAKVDRVRPQLVVFLSPPTHPKKRSKLCLI